MRHWIYAAATTISLALLGAVGQANAMPVDRFVPTAIPSDVEQAQFIFGGRNYCWYDDGWRGPGFYWCGYAFRRGLGWGGGAGWHGWQRGGPGRIGHGGRPGGRPGIGRPGGGRPGGGHAGGGRPGGGRPGGGHPGGGGHGGGGHGHR
jgi:hypothetical protein